jgi:oxygen-independent coproporphyrinogen III oxidase
MTLQVYSRAIANPLRATVMYPPDRRLFRPFRVEADPFALVEQVGARAGLYAHVPFCETKCTYCDYETVPLAKHAGAGVEAYVDALCKELEAVLAKVPRRTTISGFDIGGGTPGVLSVDQIARVIRTVERSRVSFAADFEISLETTPTLASADPTKWRAVRDLGVSRVSMGVQTDEATLLTRLNRAPQGSERMRRGIDALRSFPLVNLDLMFALPGLTVERFAATVDFAISLAPDVITTYDTVYKNRGIATQAPRLGLVPTREDYGAQYDAAFSRLNAAGYCGRYGTVNFSRVPDRLGTSRYLESRILDGVDYLGVGLYASSLHGTTWRFGKKSYRAYLQTPGAAQDVYSLPVEHVMAKYLLLQLSYGYLDEHRFEARFGEPLGRRYERVLDFLCAQRLFERTSDGYALVGGTFGELPGIRALFYPEDALTWLEAKVI